MKNQSLREVVETTYLGVVLTDDISCAKIADRAKLAFIEKIKSIYHEPCFVDRIVLLYLFRLHAMSFYGAGTWYIKFNKKYLKKIQYLIIKLSSLFAQETLAIPIMSVLSM